MTAVTFFTLLIWCIALVWIWRVLTVLRNLPRIPDLLDGKYAGPLHMATRPLIFVVVPARNEAQAIEDTLRSLLAQQGVSLEILAVNDRSTDGTGDIMDRVATEARARGKSLSVIHISELPAGWMGKTHAMALAAQRSTAPWLLFTDGDIFFREDCLRRAMQYAEKETDHLALFPTLIYQNFGERMMLSAFQALSFLSLGLWKVADPKSTRNSVGIGAFNLVRRDVYQRMGGFEPLRMEVNEDLRFGYEIKRQGFRQRIVFGRDLARVHWASGALGIAHNLTKNTFAIFRFKPVVLVGVCVGIMIFCLAPLAGFFGSWTMRLGSLLAYAAAWLLFRYSGRKLTGIFSGYLFVFPVAACLIVYSMLRSMAFTLARGGVVWRGTFYPLAELRRLAGPLR
jgi:cellulose synthase/poly-beta-1,6-N-acetylglucosamine synthase-like glycosyltransferase